MRLIHPKVEIVDNNSPIHKMLERLKQGGVQNESEVLTKLESVRDNINDICGSLGWLCYKIICDRAAANNIIIESNFQYAHPIYNVINATTDADIEFVIPYWLNIKPKHLVFSPNPELGYLVENSEELWVCAAQNGEHFYKAAVQNGWTYAQANQLLPDSTATYLMVSGSLTNWQSIFQNKNPLYIPTARKILEMLLTDLKKNIPFVFDNFENEPQKKNTNNVSG